MRDYYIERVPKINYISVICQNDDSFSSRCDAMIQTEAVKCIRFMKDSSSPNLYARRRRILSLALALHQSGGVWACHQSPSLNTCKVIYQRSSLIQRFEERSRKIIKRETKASIGTKVVFPIMSLSSWTLNVKQKWKKNWNRNAILFNLNALIRRICANQNIRDPSWLSYCHNFSK